MPTFIFAQDLTQTQLEVVLAVLDVAMLAVAAFAAFAFWRAYRPENNQNVSKAPDPMPVSESNRSQFQITPWRLGEASAGATIRAHIEIFEHARRVRERMLVEEAFTKTPWGEDGPVM